MSVVGGETSPNVGRRGASAADVVVAGAAGRMGNRIIACLAGQSDLRLVAALEAPGHAALGRDAGELAGISKAGVSVGADAGAEVTRERVLIEFSVPEASLAHLRLVAQAGARAVIGTTGFSPAQRAEIGELAKRAAILMSPNMSVATNVAFKLLATMAKALGDEYDVEITEIHHRFKKDAPSGTALRMAGSSPPRSGAISIRSRSTAARDCPASAPNPRSASSPCGPETSSASTRCPSAPWASGSS